MDSTNIADEIDAMKAKFQIVMQKHYFKKSMNGPWTRIWVKTIIKMLKCSSNLPQSEILLYFKYVKNKYVLGDNNGEEVVRVSQIGEGSGIQALPWEDAFEEIWTTHVECDHGDVDKTMKMLSEKYLVDKACISSVIKLCSVCNNKLKSNLIFNKRASLEILNMSTKPDGCYKFLLIYIDEYTGLVQLRALETMERLLVSLKMIQIFTDLGPPRVVKIYNKFNYEVMNIINLIFENCPIKIETYPYSNSRSEKIKEFLEEWMKKENSTHWGIGCNMVQWKINNIGSEGKIPQELVFGHNKCDYVKPTKRVFEKKGSKQEETIHDYEIVASEAGNVEPLAVSGPSRVTDLPTSSIEPTSQISLFEDPNMYSYYLYPNPLDSNSPKPTVTVNLDDDDMVIEEDPLKKECDIDNDSNDRLEHNMEYVKSDNESCNEDGTDSKDSTSSVEDLPSTSYIPDSSVIKLESPVGYDVSDSADVCMECTTQIQEETYTCIKCMKTIHYECGEKIIGMATDDPIACLSCVREIDD